MIREDLLEFKYYLERLSKFMQDSYGIDEHVKTFWAQLEQINKVYDEFLEEIDIFKEDSFSSENNPLLNKIGAIFGCDRNFTIPLYSSTIYGQIDGYYTINLKTDKEFLYYIKTQIKKRYFEGTREYLQDVYSTYLNNIQGTGIVDLAFVYLTEQNTSGYCQIYWNIDSNSPEYSESLKMLFNQGYLTIESLGIVYRRAIVDFNRFTKFSSADQTSFSDLTFFQYTGKAYNLLKEEPEDWSTSYSSYYKITESQNSSDTWDSTKEYYKKYGDNVYVKILEEPRDWPTDYDSYLFLTLEAAGSQYIENMYWKGLNELGGFFS